MAALRVPMISLALLLSFFLSGSQSSTILNYNNNCPYSVYVAASPTIDEGIWEFPSGSSTFFETPDQWSGSIWFRTGCSTNPTDQRFTCDTGDCGSGDMQCFGTPPKYPVTLLNLSINQTVVTYEASLIHGFNIPITLVPDGGSANTCPSVACNQDLVKSCPAELLEKNSKGVGVACSSACDAFKDPSYCCTGAYAGAACQPNKYSSAFKQACPLAHTYPQDGNPPLGRCSGANRYLITMCISS